MKKGDNIVLSFDIGIKNLAFCLLRHRTGDREDQNNNNDDHACVTILKWAIADISRGQNKPSFDDICSNLVVILKEMVSEIEGMMNEGETVTVLIENQPAFKNPTMKSIQIVVYAFFKILGDRMHPKLISATVKNKHMQSKGYEIKPKDYKQAKQSSIRFINEYLQKHDLQEAQQILQSRSKKDDLCDCLLQAIAFLE